MAQIARPQASTDPLELIRRHAVLTYFVLTFAISWGGMLLVIGGRGGVPTTTEEITTVFPVAYLVTVAGPSLAAILLTGLVSGRDGFRELGSRLLRWRVGVRWYAVALLTAPLSVIPTLLALSLLSPEFLPGFLTASDTASPSGLGLSMSLGMVVALSLSNGFVEELGWTGFAIPRMYRRYGVFATGLSVGLLWGAWHFVSNLALSGGSSAPVPLAVFMPVLLFSFLPPFRVLMVWVYDRTESLLVAMLMHASLDAFWLASTPPGMSPLALVTWYLAWAALLWILVAVVALANGWRLTQLRRTNEPDLIGRRAA
jgi:membrane protease YdiL (CAAX protease family)